MTEQPATLTPCPLCRCPALLELCDPAGVAFCPRCGLIITRLYQRLRIPVTALTRETPFRELGMDSFDVLEMLLDLEDEFGAEAVEEAARCGTLGELIDCLTQPDHGRAGSGTS